MSALEKNILDKTVADIVLENPRRSRVFEEFGIDYCCGGKITLRDSCKQQGVEEKDVIQALAANDSDSSGQGQFMDWKRLSVKAIVQYILDIHHSFLKAAMPRLQFLVEKVAHTHGGNYPELAAVLETYRNFHDDMEVHMQKEESTIFPGFIQLEDDANNKVSNRVAATQIKVLMMEHDDAGSDLKSLRQLTNNYMPPERACNTYRAMLDGLAELERDTLQHVHLENNVLFPRILALLGENEFKAQEEGTM